MLRALLRSTSCGAKCVVVGTGLSNPPRFGVLAVWMEFFEAQKEETIVKRSDTTDRRRRRRSTQE